MEIADIIVKLKERSGLRHIHLYPPATDEMISEFERKLNLSLPGDIKMFYKFCNGFEFTEDMLRIIPLEEIADDLNSKVYGTNHFFIAEYSIYCDIWQAELTGKELKDFQIFYVDELKNKIILTKSFAQFLDRALTGGVYRWHQEIKTLT